MRKFLVAGLALTALALYSRVALAGDYHTGTTLICADCHTMHYSMQHDFAGGSQGITMGAGGPHEFLLKAEPNALCLQCHDNQSFAPDVMGANANGYVRQAGGLTTGDAPYEDWKGHTLGSTATPPGNDGNYAVATGLECVNCHHQHGKASSGYPAGYTRGQFRNLTDKPGIPEAVAASYPATPLSYAVGTNDLTLDVFERSNALGNPATHYSIANVDFNEPNTTKSAYAQWCKSCHTDFHGAKGGAEVGGDTVTNWDWHRHPNADVNIGAQNAHGHSNTGRAFNSAGKTNWVKTMDPTGQWAYSTATDAAPGGYTPSCFTCHKAHGNQNAFGLIQMAPTGTVTEEGAGTGTTAKTLCKQCHSQG